MALLEDQTLAFVVRIWREKGERGGINPEWRGVIEHVASGQRQYFRDLKAMITLLEPYLAELGIDPHDRFWDAVGSWEADPPDNPATLADIEPQSIPRKRQPPRRKE
jgi:hypothetical protein